MERAATLGMVFRFGLFEANPIDGLLSRSGTKVKIQDQPFRLLLLLLERPGEVVTREELRQRLWPEGTYVDFDGSLNVILKRLRAAIDDDPDNPRFIETIPRRGYRVIAPVSVIETAQEKPLANATATAAPQTPVEGFETSANASDTVIELPGSRQQRRRLLVYGTSALAVLLIAVAGWIAWQSKESGHRRSSENPPVRVRKSVAVLGFHNLSGSTENAWL